MKFNPKEGENDNPKNLKKKIRDLFFAASAVTITSYKYLILIMNFRAWEEIDMMQGPLGHVRKDLRNEK